MSRYASCVLLWIFPVLTSTQAFTPVAILLITWATRISEPSRKLLLIVLMISSGVAVTSKGERFFSWIGFLIQAGGVGVSTTLLRV